MGNVGEKERAHCGRSLLPGEKNQHASNTNIFNLKALKITSRQLGDFEFKITRRFNPRPSAPINDRAVSSRLFGLIQCGVGNMN